MSTATAFAPARSRSGRPPEDVHERARRQHRWLFSTLAGFSARQIAADPVLSEGYKRRAIQLGVAAAKARLRAGR